MTGPLLELERLRVRYRDALRAAPQGVSLRVEPGEAVLLLGPSGSGKSTLALVAGGLLRTSGEALVEGGARLRGRETATLPPGHAAEHVAMVFQDPDAQLITDTVADEVAFGPENLCLPAEEVEQRTEAALRAVDLWPRRHEAPEALSGGGRQRLAIACALALGSPLLVLDEPTANLDAAGTREVYATLRELLAAGSHGLLLIEHNLDAALEIATRVVVLDRSGLVIADGPPRRVFNDDAELLQEAGVWLPTGLQAARALAAAGAPLPGLPLTAVELVAQLDRAAPEPRSTPTPAVAAADAAAAPAPLLEVRELRHAIDGRDILHGISFALTPGTITALVGRNGAGKSTLLRLVAGVERPPRGAVSLAGQELSKLSPRRLRQLVGMVFQNPEHQFLRQSVRDELELGLDMGDPVIAARVAEVLDRFGLHERADAHPFLLSGGEKRRLSVGTALIAGAPLLVLDEPTYGQDRARAEELMELLLRLRDSGSAVLLATHDLQLVAEHADGVLLLDRGVLRAQGTVESVFGSGALADAGLGLPPLAQALQDSRRPQLRRVASVSGLVEQYRP